MEVHDNPAQAQSDGANALDLKLLPEVLDQLIAVHNARSPQNIQWLDESRAALGLQACIRAIPLRLRLQPRRLAGTAG